MIINMSRLLLEAEADWSKVLLRSFLKRIMGLNPGQSKKNLTAGSDKSIYSNILPN